jgi:hypothetical protein
MRFLVKCLLLLWCPLTIVAQDSVVAISSSMFDSTSDQLFLASMDGWVFKRGKDTAWAGNNTKTEDWNKLKPTTRRDRKPQKTILAFTTKPTGQGTGLRLSLAYDIIKAHGGQIKVEIKEEGGSDFIIQLPA